MRIPLSWLKEYVDLDVTPEKLADLLIMSGTEVEILSDIKGDFEKIVVGEILEITPHPNADRLRVTKTSVGGQDLQIVCGASNIEVGQKVPVALVGARFGESEIKEAEIRGVKSYGMLCSESELGISDDHTGIMILDPRTKPGENIESALGSKEIIFEAEITPNRGDLLSMIGISREVSAILDKKVILPNVSVKESSEGVKDLISVDIQDKDLCSRYIARIIKNVKIGPSPKWLQDRLSSSGIRSINNIVDVSNYVMLEFGQPLHMFDLDKIKGGQATKKIIVRRAKEAETIRTLDGIDRKLTSGDLVIADGVGPIAIAGVMGGENSEVTPQTTDVVIESANFSPTTIRRTALRLALRSEASSRFEKGLPIFLQEEAVDRAAELIAKISEGEVCEGMVDEGEHVDKTKVIELDSDRVKHFLGVDVSSKESKEILSKLGFEVSQKNDVLRVKVPSWRLDVSLEEDLLEEIARIYGYDRIPTTLPKGEMPYPEKNILLDVVSSIRKSLVGFGFNECYSYSFVDDDNISHLSKDKKAVVIANPISQDQRIMRKDHLKSLLQVASKNKGQKNGKIFEIAAVYLEGEEPTKISALVIEKKDISHSALLGAKGTVESIFDAHSVKEVHYQQKDLDPFSTGVEIIVGGKPSGVMGIVKDEVSTQYKLAKKEIAFFELDLETISSSAQAKKFSSIPRFPKSERDLAFVVKEEVRVGDIIDVLKNTKSTILKEVAIVDIFRGRGLPEGKKSVAVNFVYQHVGRTLTDAEILEDQKKIINIVESQFGGKLRSERTD